MEYKEFIKNINIGDSICFEIRDEGGYLASKGRGIVEHFYICNKQNYGNGKTFYDKKTLDFITNIKKYKIKEGLEWTPYGVVLRNITFDFKNDPFSYCYVDNDFCLSFIHVKEIIKNEI